MAMTDNSSTYRSQLKPQVHSSMNQDGTVEPPTAARKFLSSGVAFNFKSPLVIGVALALVAAATLLIVRADTVSSAEESVTLSDGREVHLGEPTDQLASDLGSDLHKVNDQLFQYPSDKLKPVEVIILAQNSAVSAIQIIHGGSNKLSSTGVGVDSTTLQLALQLRNRLAPLQASLLNLNLRGFQVNQTRSVAYLLNSPCGNVSQLSGITVALKDYANQLVAQTLAADCSAIKD